MKNNSRLYFIIACILAIMHAFSYIVFAFIVKEIIDIITLKNITFFFRYLFFGIGTIIIEFLLAVVSRYFSLKYVQDKLENSKNYLFQSLIYADLSDKTPSDLSMYSTNIELIYGNYYINKVLIVYYIAQFVFSVMAVIYLNWILFVITFLTSLLPILVPLIFQKSLSKSIKDFTDESTNYLDFITDSLNGRYEIKSFNAQDMFCQYHRVRNYKVEFKRMKNKLLTYFTNMLASILSSFTYLSTIGISGYLVIVNLITMGAMYAVIQLLNSMISPVIELGKAIGEMKSTKNLAQQYFINLPKSEGSIKINEFNSQLNLNNISYSYDNDNLVFESFNLEIEKGKKYAIVGDSGSGKTTLAKIMAGIITDYDGEVLIDGEDIRNIDSSSYVEVCKYIHQEPYVFNDTIENNIRMGRDYEDIFKILDFLKLSDFIKKRGLSAIISNKESISGGQKQRIVLSRALYSKPQILILDEPTANIHFDASYEIIKSIVSIEELTLIVITHEQSKEFLDLFDIIIPIKGSVLSYDK